MENCLLYTSDAADEEDSVDLGGRRIIKKKKLKKSKIGIFPKGLVHGFGQKFENFPSFYFWQNQLAKCV